MDNTYSSLIRIVRFTPQCVQNDLVSLSQFIISYLPFKTDLTELENCYEFLCEIVEQDLMNIESKYGKPTLVEIMKCMIEAFVIADNRIPQKLMDRVKACSQKLVEANQQKFQEVLASMDQYRKNVFPVTIIWQANETNECHKRVNLIRLHMCYSFIVNELLRSIITLNRKS